MLSGMEIIGIDLGSESISTSSPKMTRDEGFFSLIFLSLHSLVWCGLLFICLFLFGPASLPPHVRNVGTLLRNLYCVQVLTKTFAPDALCGSVGKPRLFPV